MVKNSIRGKQKAILSGLIINSSYAVIELGFGFFTGSMALIADAIHNLTDTLILLISFFADKIANRNPDSKKTFGYGRATILAVLLNAGIMFFSACLIIYESILRFNSFNEIQGGLVAVIAFIGIIVNGSISYLLSKHKDELNIKTAYIDMLYDALTSFGAMVSGLVIYFGGVQNIDSIIGIYIALLLLFNTFKLLKEAVAILFESTPAEVDYDAIVEAIKSQKLIIKVDDIHIWTIKSGYNALSCHIVIDEVNISKSRFVVDKLKKLLAEEYNIQHSTIEVEFKDCSPAHNY